VANSVEALVSVGARLRLMYQDEGRFGRISTPRRCWAPRGMRPEVPAQIVREYTYAFVALSPHDGVMDSLVLPLVSEEAMSLFSREVSERHPDEFILMVLDGEGWHKAKAHKVPENMALIFLPPYSPQLNPVEHIRDSIRESHFGNEVLNSIGGVREPVGSVPGGPRTGSRISGKP
jgi:hypothetical protein